MADRNNITNVYVMVRKENQETFSGKKKNWPVFLTLKSSVVKLTF